MRHILFNENGQAILELSSVHGYLDLLLTRPVDHANNEFVFSEREGNM